MAVLNHDWLEIGDRRWCVRSFRSGGCGLDQYRRTCHCPWEPAAEATCEAQRDANFKAQVRAAQKAITLKPKR